MKFRFCIVLALIIGSLTQAAQAEQAYITDSVTVGLFANKDLSGEPTQRLLSGAPVEVLQSLNGVSEVKTVQGGQGWLRESFLTRATPAIVKLEQATNELNQLENELDEAKEKITELAKAANEAKNLTWMRAELNKARNKAAELEKKLQNKSTEQMASGEQLSELEAALEQAKSDKVDLEQRLAAVMLINNETAYAAENNEDMLDGGIAISLGWLLLAVILAVGAGGAAVYYWFSQRLRQRFGGVKVL